MRLWDMPPNFCDSSKEWLQRRGFTFIVDMFVRAHRSLSKVKVTLYGWNKQIIRFILTLDTYGALSLIHTVRKQCFDFFGASSGYVVTQIRCRTYFILRIAVTGQ